MSQSRPLCLCYHALSADWQSSLAVPPAVFEQHVASLARGRYESFTFAESEARRASGDLPRRSVVFTFDDGYASTLLARPILDAHGFVATVFPVVPFVDSGDPLTWPGIEQWLPTHRAELAPLSWHDLEGLRDAGWEVGGHTLTHPPLTQVDDERLAHELAAPRETIARRLGSCTTVAYPFGAHDERVAAAARDQGYVAACTLDLLGLDTPLRRPRIGLFAGDVGWRGQLKLSPAAQTPILRALRRAALAVKKVG